MLQYLTIMLDAAKAKKDERGASAVEYGLLVAAIAALIVVIVFALGGILIGLLGAFAIGAVSMIGLPPAAVSWAWM